MSADASILCLPAHLQRLTVNVRRTLARCSDFAGSIRSTCLPQISRGSAEGLHDMSSDTSLTLTLPCLPGIFHNGVTMSLDSLVCILAAIQLSVLQQVCVVLLRTNCKTARKEFPGGNACTPDTHILKGGKAGVQCRRKRYSLYGVLYRGASRSCLQSGRSRRICASLSASCIRCASLCATPCPSAASPDAAGHA